MYQQGDSFLKYYFCYEFWFKNLMQTIHRSWWLLLIKTLKMILLKVHSHRHISGISVLCPLSLSMSDDKKKLLWIHVTHSQYQVQCWILTVSVSLVSILWRWILAPLTLNFFSRMSDEYELVNKNNEFKLFLIHCIAEWMPKIGLLLRKIFMN